MNDKLRKTGRYYTYTVDVSQRWRGKLYPWYTDSVVARTVPEATRLYELMFGKWDRKKFTVTFTRGPVARRGDV